MNEWKESESESDSSQLCPDNALRYTESAAQKVKKVEKNGTWEKNLNKTQIKEEQ